MASPFVFPPHILHAESPHKRRPAQYLRGDPDAKRGRYQDGRRLRHVKASKAFIWPKDGKNDSTWGRMKDVLHNKGPDIFVAFGARPTDCVSNRPSRAQWSKHVNLDDTGVARGFNAGKFAPWVEKGYLGGREEGESYDFRTRKHSTPNLAMWTDAIWPQEKSKINKRDMWPEAFRTMSGNWWQDTWRLPQWQGGPGNTEFGRGDFAFNLPHGPQFMPPPPFWGGDFPQPI